MILARTRMALISTAGADFAHGGSAAGSIPQAGSEFCRSAAGLLTKLPREEKHVAKAERFPDLADGEVGFG